MAAAHGALTGRPAAVLVTRAVGAANLAVALHAAQADSVPMIVIVGQVERAARGREAFQEADVVATFGGLCRWAREVRDVAALPGALDDAFRRATTGRPGPVLLSIAQELFDAPAPADGGRIATGTVLGPPRAPEPDAVTLKRILHLLLDAQRPVILAGAGVLRSRATADLVRLAEFADIPVVAAWRRPDVFPNDHALYLGMSGFFAAPTVHPRLLEADAVLVLGCRLNEVASHGWTVPAAGARWAHVDLEPLGARGGLGAPTIALASDARTFVREARRVLGGGVLEMASLERRRAANVADRAAYEEACQVDRSTVGRPRCAPGSRDRDPRQDPAPGRDRHDGRGALRRLGRPRPVDAPPRHLPRPDVRCHGLRASRGDRRVDRLARPPDRCPRRRRRARDERRRAGDRRQGGRAAGRHRLRQRPLRDDPRPPGEARHDARRHGPGTRGLGGRRPGLRGDRRPRGDRRGIRARAPGGAWIAPAHCPAPGRRPALGERRSRR